MLTDKATAYELADSHVCLDCGQRSRLVARWNGSANSYEVACRCGNLERFVKPRSLTQMWRSDPNSVPVTVANRLAAKYGGERMETTTALTVTNQKRMLERIDRVRWPEQLTPAQKLQLAEVAIQYGYDPAMGELILYEGRIYITLLGRIRDAHRVKGFQGIEDRPMTAEERKAYNITAPYAWIAKAYRADWRVPAVGIGTADPQKPHRGKQPVEVSNPAVMARSRAIRQCVQLFAPSALPQDQDAEEAGVFVDTTTGEIIEATAREVTTEAAEPQQSTPEKPTPKELARWDDLWREAMAFKIEGLEPLPANVSRAELIERGKVLVQKVAEARAKPLATIDEPAPAPAPENGKLI